MPKMKFSFHTGYVTFPVLQLYFLHYTYRQQKRHATVMSLQRPMYREVTEMPSALTL